MPRYPAAKKKTHTGDSYIIYEAGNRKTDYPPSGLEDLIDETEGQEADESVTFPVDTRNLTRNDTGYPGDDTQVAPKLNFPPGVSWEQKVLSRYRRSDRCCSSSSHPRKKSSR